MKRPPIEAVIGSNVRRLRALHDVSQAEMGRKSGVSQKTISNIERDGEIASPKAGSLDLVARYFSIHPALLMIENLPDEALQSSKVSEMMVQFAQLDHHHQRRIQELIADFSRLSAVPGAANETEPQ